MFGHQARLGLGFYYLVVYKVGPPVLLLHASPITNPKSGLIFSVTVL